MLSQIQRFCYPECKSKTIYNALQSRGYRSEKITETFVKVNIKQKDPSVTHLFNTQSLYIMKFFQSCNFENNYVIEVFDKV